MCINYFSATLCFTDSRSIRDSSKKYFIDPSEISIPRSNVEMMSPLKDGLIDNWDLFEQLLDHSYKRHIRSDSELHPVLMSEAPVRFDFHILLLFFYLLSSPFIPFLFLFHFLFQAFLGKACYRTRTHCLS